MGLLEFDFDDASLPDQDTLRASVRMFVDLNLLEKFHINQEVGLCNNFFN